MTRGVLGMKDFLQLEEVVCNHCGSARSRVLYDRPYHADSIAKNAVYAATTDNYSDYGRIVRCQDCGLVYTNPRPHQGNLLAGYSACVDNTYLAENSSRSINAHLCLSTINSFVKSGRLLEIGCFAGHFLNAARADFDAEGIEPSEWACKIARDRFKLSVRQEPFTADSVKAESFDVVTLIDVIEHMSDPMDTLTNAVRALRPGGLIYLVTPDIGSLSARLLRGSWWGLRPAHIYYFDTRTMTRMMEKAGLEVVLVKSFGRIFTCGYWVDRLQNYPQFIFRPLRWIINRLDLNSKFVYVNTRDTMEICAVKK